jgi:amino acid transporter
VDGQALHSLGVLIIGEALIGLGIGQTMAPSTTLIMTSVRTSKSRVGSAVNDFSRELGALGIAVLGSVLNSVYRGKIGARLPLGLPPNVAAHAHRSVTDALLDITNTTYAAAVAFGPAKFAGSGVSGSASWVPLARSLFGIAWFFVFLGIVNSTIANANAGYNVTSRTAFAMGRIRVFPSPLATLNRRYQSPSVAIAITTLIAVAVTLGLGFGYGPDQAFAMVGTGIVIILAAVYILVDAACIGYFLRHREHWNPLQHLVVPVFGIPSASSRWAWCTSTSPQPLLIPRR